MGVGVFKTTSVENEAVARVSVGGEVAPGVEGYEAPTDVPFADSGPSLDPSSTRHRGSERSGWGTKRESLGVSSRVGVRLTQVGHTSGGPPTP